MLQRKFFKDCCPSNKNIECARKIDLDEFKSEWTKFTHRKRTAKYYKKKKSEN